MKTLQEDIDDLDRMVDTGAQKDAIRSQIRLIAREVAASHADYASLAERHAKLAEDKAAVDRQLEDIKERGRKAMNDFLTRKAEEQRKLRESYSLNYRA
jgi:uncharacterized protein involved in exopolysaccharide biosynthesis